MDDEAQHTENRMNDKIPPLNFAWQNNQQKTREQTPLNHVQPIFANNTQAQALPGMIQPEKPLEQKLQKQDSQGMKVDIATINYQPVQHIYNPQQQQQQPTIPEEKPLFGMPGSAPQDSEEKPSYSN